MFFKYFLFLLIYVSQIGGLLDLAGGFALLERALKPRKFPRFARELVCSPVFRSEQRRLLLNIWRLPTSKSNVLLLNAAKNNLSFYITIIDTFFNLKNLFCAFVTKNIVCTMGVKHCFNLARKSLTIISSSARAFGPWCII